MAQTKTDYSLRIPLAVPCRPRARITVAGIRAYHSAHAFYANGVAVIGS